MGEYNIKELLNQASTGIINLNDYISKEDFKQQLYDYATTQGIEYQDFRALISNIGEDSVIENLDIKRLVSSPNGERVFTMLLERGNNKILDNICKDTELRDLFINNLDKNFSMISAQSHSKQIKTIVESLNKEGNWSPKASYLLNGLSQADKTEILMGNYEKDIVKDVIRTADNSTIEHYLKFNPRAFDTIKEVGVVRLAEKGVTFPPKITSQKDFFESLKSHNMVQFRKNINHVYRTSYNPVLEGRIKNYEKEILESLNGKTGISSLYDLDNPEALENILKSKDPYIADYDVRKEIGEYLTSQKYMESKFQKAQDTLRQRLNLNIDVQSMDTIEIDGISDNPEVIESLYRLKDSVTKMKQDFTIIKGKVEKSLSNISNKKFDEVFQDYMFSDTKNNVEINIEEILRFNNSLGEEKELSQEREELYEKIHDIERLSPSEKVEMYNGLKDKNMAATLYKDFAKLRNRSYVELNKALYKSKEMGENISLAKTEELGLETQELKGDPFYMLVRVLNTPYREDTNQEFSCYSLISDKNTNVFGHDRESFIYGYDSVDPKLIENVFESDSYTMTGSQNKTERPNRLMLPKDIVESDSSYSEINVKNVNNDEGKEKKYKEMRPSYLVCMDKEPSKELLDEAKRLGIPITMVDREKYKEAQFKKNEYKEYDSDIN